MIKKWLLRWYQGRDVPVDPDEPDEIGGMGVLHATCKEYHWTATAARSFVAFYMSHWKWLWGSAIALLGIFVSLYIALLPTCK